MALQAFLGGFMTGFSSMPAAPASTEERNKWRPGPIPPAIVREKKLIRPLANTPEYDLAKQVINMAGTRAGVGPIGDLADAAAQVITNPDTQKAVKGMLNKIGRNAVEPDRTDPRNSPDREYRAPSPPHNHERSN